MNAVRNTRILFVLKDTSLNGLTREVSYLLRFLGRCGCESIVAAYRDLGNWAEIIGSLAGNLICCDAIRDGELKASENLVQIVANFMPHIVYVYIDSFIALERLCRFRPKIRIIKAEGRKIMEDNENRIHLYREFGSYFDYIVVTSEAMKQKFKELGLASKNCVVLQSAVDTDLFVPPTNKKKAKENIGLHPTSHVCLNVARVVPHKRPDKFTNIAKIIMASGHKTLFLWVGCISQGDSDKLSRYSPVSFLGEQIDPRPFYEAADIFLMTSDNESAPNALLEAMSSGLPVVTTKSYNTIGDIVVKHVGYIISTEDQASAAISELITLPNKAREMGLRGREYVIEKYSISHRMIKFKELFLE
jgi:glycosyltransferase involved in cell wall biosynthesis